MAPLVHRIGEDRLADLLGAGGSDHSAIFVELEAAILEGQPEILEQTARFALEIESS